MNSIFNSVLLAVISLAEESSPYASILIGSLPADNGISIYIAAGSPVYDMSKGTCYEMILTLNGKHAEQETVADALGIIHDSLSTRKQYPTTADGCQITNIETVSPPAYLDREANNQWLYGSSLKVKFYKPKGE